MPRAMIAGIDEVTMGTATKQDVREWLIYGKEQLPNCTHMLVVCDTFDHDDYPVYVPADEDVRDVARAHDGVNMQQLMEVYDLSMDLESQLAEERAFHR